jgi:acetamidase/formamidase
MVDYLVTRRFDRQQTYALCGRAVDLLIAQTVDEPNMLALVLPLDIFLRT